MTKPDIEQPPQPAPLTPAQQQRKIEAQRWFDAIGRRLFSVQGFNKPLAKPKRR